MTDLQLLNTQLEKVRCEMEHAKDLAQSVDERDGLRFDMYELDDIVGQWEVLTNRSEGIDDDERQY